MCEITDWPTALLLLVALIEWGLGRTNLVEANSTIDMILNGVRSFVGMFARKKDN